MPHNRETVAQLNEDLRALTRANEVIYDSYEHGEHMRKALAAGKDVQSRKEVFIWVLMFLTRKPDDPISE